MIDIEEEKKIVEKAKSDLNAFGDLYDMYAKKIYTFVAYMVGNGSEAEDIVSETFEKAMLNIEKFEYKGYTFGAWLYRIARNLVYDRSKKKQNISIEGFENVIQSGEANILDQLHGEEQEELLKKMIEVLKEDQKEIVYLRYVQNYSIKEVCEITKKTEDSVKSLAKRALSNLKEMATKEK